MDYREYAKVEFGDFMLPLKKEAKFKVTCDLHPQYFPNQEVPLLGRDSIAKKRQNVCYDCKHLRRNEYIREKRRKDKENNDHGPTSVTEPV